MELRVEFLQDEGYVSVHRLNTDMCMTVAMEITLDSHGLSLDWLEQANLTVCYQSNDGMGYVPVQLQRSLAEYLRDRIGHALSTQDGRPSLYVSLCHFGKDVNLVQYIPTLLPSKEFPLVAVYMPADLNINMVHNTTLHFMTESFRSNLETKSIKTHILQNMISQANETVNHPITEDRIILYFDG